MSLSSSSTVAISIDGLEVEASPGESLARVLKEVRPQLPQVCYHQALGPIQTCDTCFVTVGGELVRACATKVTEGLEVSTRDPRSQRARHEAMQRMLYNHNLYCTVCDNNNGNCEVHEAAHHSGIEHQTYEFSPKPLPVDDSNPFYRYDPSQCIACGRCVEACQNLQVNETLSINWEADRPHVVWDGGSSIDESSCVSCGHCVTVCPCNALMEKTMLGRTGHLTDAPDSVLSPAIDMVKSTEPYLGLSPIFTLSQMEAAMRRADVKRTKTVCTYCGVGCSFEIWTRDREILKVQPQLEAPANGISTCVKGKFGWGHINSEERLTHPLIREGDGFREASWHEALNLVAKKFQEIYRRDGGQALGFIGSSKCSNEENYLMQKLARAVFKTNNVDNCSRYCQAPATQGLWRTVGYGGDSGSISDLEQASLVLIVGSNTAESHPVLATRIKRAQKVHGHTLIVSDIREHEMAGRADVFLRPNPGTDLCWLSGVTRYIIDNDLHDKEFLKKWVHGFEDYRESLQPFTLKHTSKVTGIEVSVLEDTARRIAAADSVCACWAMGVTQHQKGSDTSTAISNLLLVTGNYKRPGTGAYPLRGHNNVQGASDFGAITTFYPGYQEVSDDERHQHMEKAWGTELSQTPGLNNHQMVDAILEGKLKSLYLMGEDMALVDANSNLVQEAFEQLEFFVLQELFFTTTARFADVILPGAASLEKEGTFTNTERRIQRFYQAMEPYAECKPDWWILNEIARRCGYHWSYSGPADIMDEAAACTPMFKGVSYNRLQGFDSLQWPMNEDGTDTPLLYTEDFHFDDGKARLYPLEYESPGEPPGKEYDLHLNNGRMLEHFHIGTMTYKTEGIAYKAPDNFVEVSPELAAERELADGDWVRLLSRRGRVKVRVLVTDRVRGKELYMPLNSETSPVNLLTSSEVDPNCDTPAYKELAVKLEKLPEKGPSPLPRHNSRYGHPTPTTGVEVEKKWARPDYKAPPNPRPEGGNV